MSVEDSGSDFLSDESDYEAEEKLDDGETDVEEFSYAAMVRLHHNLINFQNIYIYNINAVIAIEVGKLIIISTDLFMYNFNQLQILELMKRKTCFSAVHCGPG